jgi:hypothetical protein
MTNEERELLLLVNRAVTALVREEITKNYINAEMQPEYADKIREICDPMIELIGGMTALAGILAGIVGHPEDMQGCTQKDLEAASRFELLGSIAKQLEAEARQTPDDNPATVKVLMSAARSAKLRMGKETPDGV